MEERIQKILSAQGYCSRRDAEKLIEAGRVTVNGRTANLGDKADSRRDAICVDGHRLAMQKNVSKHYYALHKPRGYVTTTRDSHAAKTVVDLMPQSVGRLYPVGRLDKDSEGLLLMTNDGDFANMITHPSYSIMKLYRATVRPVPTEEQITELATGVSIGEGETATPASVRVVSEGADRAALEITLNEGKNREIRRMCEAIGLEVIRLKRLAIGPIKLGMLKCGDCRELTKEELRAIRNAVSKSEG